MKRLATRLASDGRLREALEAEPDLKRVLFDAEAALPSERFRQYAVVKRAAPDLVGYGARNRDLRTREHYEAVLSCAAWLLGITERLAEPGDGERPLAG